MTKGKGKIRPIRVFVVAIALSMTFWSVSTSLECLSAQDRKAFETMPPSKPMADGKRWMIQNLNVNTGPSYCYEDAELNCRKYGRLYTWESAMRGCQSLGDGWRLPTNDEWREMAKHYGGVRGDSEDGGKAAFKSLLEGGSSGFDALLGGGRNSEDGKYERLEAHGFYWTSSESDQVNGWFYNFGKGGQILNRHNDGDKHGAFSVRCVKG